MPATINKTTPNPLPVYDGRNMSPLKPLEDLRTGKPADRHKICEFLQTRYEEDSQQDEEARREIIGIGKMIANLTTGKLLLLRNPVSNRFTFVRRDTRFADYKTVGGTFQFYRTKLDAEWLGSKPERDPVCPSDDDRIEEFISSVKTVQDYYNRKLYDDRYELNESHSAQEYGTWITRYRYDEAKQDIINELLPFPACIYDIRFRPEESPYFIYEQKCNRNLVAKMVGKGAVIPEDDESEASYGLQIIEEIARQGGGADGYGKSQTSGQINTAPNEVIVTEMWLKPETYCHIEIEDDEKTVDGTTLPKGKMLDEIFPDGLVAIGINGMKTIIGLYAENSADHIVSGVYHLQSFSGVGKGVSDAVDVQKEMNDLHSQAMAYVKSRGTPAFGYNQDLITEENARNIGKPRMNIPIDFKNAPEGVTNINQAIQAIQPQNPASGVFEYGKQLENYLQMAFQVTSFSDAMPGVDNKTATGAKIGDSNARTMLVPQHRNKADMRKRADKVVYNLFRKYMNAPKFFANNSLNGITKGKYISNKDFADVDIEFEVVADSEVPKTPYTKEESMSRLMQWTGGLGGIIEAAQMSPEITSAVVTAFGADLPIAKTDEIARVCRQRIEQAKKLLESEAGLMEMMQAVTGVPMDMSQLPTSIVAQLTPRITPKEGFHQQKVMWLSELLNVDEMMDAPGGLREIVEKMMEAHIAADTLADAELIQADALKQMLGQMPNMMLQQAMQEMGQAQQQQMQQEQMAGQQQMQQQQMIQQQEMDAQRQQVEAEQKNEQDAIAHQRQMEINGQNAKNNVILEAVKQAGSPQNTATAKSK